MAHPIPDHIGQVALDTVKRQANRLKPLVVRGTAAGAKGVAEDQQRLRVGIEGLHHLALAGVVGAEIAGNQHIGGLVVADFVIEHLHPVVGVDEDAGTGGHPGHRRARNAEVGGVVVNHSIVEHPGAVAFLWQVRHVEHQNAAGVVDRHVAEHVRMDGVLDLDARHIEFGPAVAHHDVARLADVDAGVRCADGHRALDEGVFGLHRVDAVGAVLSARAAGPFGAHPAHGDVAPVGDFQGVTGGVLNGEILDGEVAGGHQQTLRTRQLPCEAQDGLIHACPADRDAVRVEHQAPLQA